LVEDLDEIELEENDLDDFEQNFKGLEDDKGDKKTRTSFTDKNKDGENNDEEDEVNVDEDDEDEKKNTVH
jgi:hypothetical protein